MTRTLDVSLAPDRRSKDWRNSTVTREDLLEWVKNPGDRKETQGYLLGKLKGPRRLNKNVLHRSAIVLDVDSPSEQFLTEIDLTFGYDSLWHSTYSSAPGNRRYRGIVFTDRNMTPAEYPAAVRQLMTELGAEQFDVTSAEIARFMYSPAASDPAQYEFLDLQGPPVDVDALLRASGALEHAPMALEDIPGAKQDPFEIPGPVGAFNREHRDFGELVEEFGLPYMMDDSGLWGFEGSSSPPGLREIREGLWYSHHATDPAYGHAQTAFDMVRTHIEGHLDEGIAPETPIQSRPSHKAMLERVGPNDGGMQSHTRIAARFVQHAAGKCVRLYGVAGWRTWTGKVWAADPDDARAWREVQHVVKEAFAEAMGQQSSSLRTAANAASTASGIKGVLEIAGKELLEHEMDADPWVLNTQSGVLDLRSLELREPHPSDGLSRITTAAYRPDAYSAAWERFLAEAIPDPEARGFLQRFIGQALLGETREHALVILHGQQGRNGKSTFAETLIKALGDYADAASNQLIIENRYGNKSSAGDLAATMKLRGLRLATMSEIGKGERMHEARMKELTGGDTLQAKFMRENPVNWDPTHSLMMLTNDLPYVSAESEAAWARIRVVDFPNSFLGQEDTGLKQELKSDQRHLDAVLGWAVEGLRAWRADGNRLTVPETVKAATQDYRDENNPVAQFVRECCRVEANAKVAKAELLESYNYWAMVNDKQAYSDRKFPQRLKAAAPGLSEIQVKKVRFWQGIELGGEPP